MAASVRISRKCAQAFLAYFDQGLQGIDTFAIRELRAALKPRTKKALPFPTRKQSKAAKKKTKGQETKDIRAAVMARAGGKCEACVSGPHTRLEMDHFFGRVRVKQSERNCWLLCGGCHRLKTNNIPSAASWLETFVEHAEALGFDEEAGMAVRRLGALQMSRGAANG